MATSLLVIPTETECRWAGELLGQLPAEMQVAICGFGAVIAGIRTSQLIAEHRPQRVWLAGIAGALDRRLELGRAYAFSRVSCYGVGVGGGAAFQTAAEMGWQHWPGENTDSKSLPIADTIELMPAQPDWSEECRQLVTVCAASADASDVALLKQKYPLAQAEDMEGFAVAAACQLAQVPLTIIRGLANTAGNREHRHWQTTAAMRSAIELILARL